MKLYETHRAPNPRRLRIFLAEKGISIDDFEVHQIDLEGGENLTDSFRAMNPMGRVPVLKLDDGHCLSESLAICRYFEALQPEPALFGRSPLEQATIEMWNRRMELNLLQSVAMAFRHTTGHYSDREAIFPDYGANQAKNAGKLFDFLDQHLAAQNCIVGDNYTVADITALVAVDFARVIDLRIDDRKHLAAWHEQVSARPSASA